MFQDERRLTAVRDRHVELTPRQLDLCSACLQGYNVLEIADELALAAATVRREFADLQHRVFDLTGLRPTRDLLRLWASEHRACCLGAAYNQREDRSI